MYLSKLELHGFKSFAHRTSVQFDPGVTAIVGPNGCGKSNIVDAVRWVIGEQRARILRSDKMENVIFNGTSNRRALGMAEVLLTIQNNRGVLPTEYTEVTLGRRLYRSGESEYLLNGVKCRLQDITDLFMDTGMGSGAYSVIELKMVEEILSENHQDRRRLFEEAAGITRYKLRRRQALSKLDNTQADLTRLRDLTDEIDKNVRSLKRQAEKAVRFKDYEARLQILERSLAQAEFDRLTAQEIKLKDEVNRLNARVEELGNAQSAEETRSEALRAELTDAEEALAEVQQRYHARVDAVRAIESELKIESERAVTAERELERLAHEASQETDRSAALAENLSRMVHARSEAEPAATAATSAVQDLEKQRDATREAADAAQRAHQQARQEEQAADAALATARQTVDRLNTRRELLERERAQVASQMEGLAGMAGEIEARARLSARNVEEARIRLDTARKRYALSAEEAAAGRAAYEEARDDLRNSEQQRAALAAEVAVFDKLVASTAEFSDAVRFLASNKEWHNSDLVTVSDVFSCDEDDRVALDAALGTYASCVLVQDEAEAATAARFLRERRKGQATFLILDRVDGHARPAGAPPGFTLLKGRVRVSESRYEPLLDLLIGAICISDELDDRVIPQGYRLVTRTGEWAEGALLHAGSRQTGLSGAAQRLGRREQLLHAQERLAASEKQVALQNRRTQELREAMLAVPVEDALAEVTTLEKAFAEAEKASQRSSYESESMDGRHRDLNERLKRLDTELEGLAGQVAENELLFARATKRHEEARVIRACAEEIWQKADLESRSVLARFNEATVAAMQARNRLENLMRDEAHARLSLTELGSRSAVRDRQVAALNEQLADVNLRRKAMDVKLVDANAARTEAEKAVRLAEEQVLTLRSQAAGIEAGLRTIRTDRETTLRDEHTHAIRLTEVQTRTEDLLANVQEAYGLSLRDERHEITEDFEESAARIEVLDLRNKIRTLGAVNALALESYEEEKTRFEFLMTQRKDLEEAESTLLSTIDEINTTAAQRFLETYQAVQDSFSRIFSHLFGQGATASLSMVEPNDPLESPIEIMARPLGKKPSVITQLSGGEKTLTAIALLFAIYLVKPSPFCILDEVDAPLDDANVERFMQLIRDFSGDTQFILVTHNKRTMEAADRMYGVTMQEQGVSQLVGVQFADAQNYAA